MFAVYTIYRYITFMLIFSVMIPSILTITIGKVLELEKVLDWALRIFFAAFISTFVFIGLITTHYLVFFK